jgi:hypothetical protein
MVVGETTRAVFDGLTGAQQWALDRLWERRGLSCGLNYLVLESLHAKGLIAVYIHPSGGARACGQDGHALHVRYCFPPGVMTAYEHWTAQWTKDRACLHDGEG